MFANFPWPGRGDSDKSVPMPSSFLKVPDSENRFGGNDGRQRAAHLFIAVSKDISGQKPAAGGRAGPSLPEAGGFAGGRKRPERKARRFPQAMEIFSAHLRGKTYKHGKNCL
ncbi:MAG: hypothetical protein C6P37_11625 [Caldibacillus debilis]|uniref:Uncharacterized protein n=1 Tax=Caldibacillus debilis TaxID=301148 RepID=A0A3E0K2V1_9BACI|nr:MAG: hypothetical protein BAA03_05460 [Caldibacillus debilis]REJ14950.1 MAG: hypothetical protein C6W57_12475 [Caldibacillus debilis]REJ27461.1 MAG: hypothetical protein C6P37_11625 [Caldibacillus debilis]